LRADRDSERGDLTRTVLTRQTEVQLISSADNGGNRLGDPVSKDSNTVVACPIKGIKVQPLKWCDIRRGCRGCNVVLLWMARATGYQTPRFLTFKQALQVGGNVRKGERGTKVYFVK
jgi:hypothetical protein